MPTGADAFDCRVGIPSHLGVARPRMGLVEGARR